MTPAGMEWRVSDGLTHYLFDGTRCVARACVWVAHQSGGTPDLFRAEVGGRVEDFGSLGGARAWAEQQVVEEVRIRVASALVGDGMGRWRLLKETTPSGKAMFECRACGKKTPTPMRKRCYGREVDCEEEWERSEAFLVEMGRL